MGDFNLLITTSWYELYRRYRTNEKYLRAPQLSNYQFTGFGLGLPSGATTANGLPNRLQILETRDFQRMRLGLGTILLGDGFFGYDYIDNTTAPVWFDEYAVNSAGIPVMDIDAKGYLGQPLGESVELSNSNSTQLFDIDFEANSSWVTGLEFYNFEFTEDSNDIISGTKSIKYSSSSLLEDEVLVAFISDATELPLTPDTHYQLTIDYKVLLNEAIDRNFGLFSIRIQDPSPTNLTPTRQVLHYGKLMQDRAERYAYHLRQ